MKLVAILATLAVLGILVAPALSSCSSPSTGCPTTGCPTTGCGGCPTTGCGGCPTGSDISSPAFTPDSSEPVASQPDVVL
jgi:hypothetical protein